MRLQHTHFILKVFCLLVYSSPYCFCIPADALPLAESHGQPPLHGDHLGSVTFPVYVHKGPARRVLDPSLASSSNHVPQLRSELITLAEPFGQFFAKLQIGTPPEDIALILDTGSELTWIQCMPCLHCGEQAFPIFDPAKSSSYQNLNCAADMCQQIGTACSSDSSTCSYNVSYVDKSFSYGNLAKETLTFTIADASTAAGTTSFTWPQFLFGCGFDNEGVESQFNASGLMGVDRAMYSITSQLRVQVFSYCLPNRVHNVDVYGYLTFSRGTSNSPSLQYTPMIQNKYSLFLSQFYYLNLGGVSVDGNLLDIPAVAFEISATGGQGTIIDSGTTLTTFVDEAYTVIVHAFENYMGASYKRMKTSDSKLCYEVPLATQGGAPTAPQVTLHFEGSVDMELSTDQLFYLYGSDTTNNYYCLAFASGGPLATNVIGNYQQQDFLVEYDLANSRIGFAPTHCSQHR